MFVVEDVVEDVVYDLVVEFGVDGVCCLFGYCFDYVLVVFGVEDCIFD